MPLFTLKRWRTQKFENHLFFERATFLRQILLAPFLRFSWNDSRSWSRVFFWGGCNFITCSASALEDYTFSLDYPSSWQQSETELPGIFALAVFRAQLSQPCQRKQRSLLFLPVIIWVHTLKKRVGIKRERESSGVFTLPLFGPNPHLRTHSTLFTGLLEKMPRNALKMLESWGGVVQRWNAGTPKFISFICRKLGNLISDCDKHQLWR